MEEKKESIFPIDIRIQDVREAIKEGKDIREFVFEEYIVTNLDSPYFLLHFTFLLLKITVIKVFSYTLIKEDTFPDPKEAPDERTKLLWQLRRECRGLIFSKEGKVLARRFHKFFNLNEKKETKLENIPFSSSTKYVLLTKLDGSMISPFLLNDSVVWASKKGPSPVATSVTEYVTDLEKQGSEMKYNLFVRDMFEKGNTIMFEWWYIVTY